MNNIISESLLRKVLQHAKCMDHANLHGKPFGTPLVLRYGTMRLKWKTCLRREEALQAHLLMLNFTKVFILLDKDNLWVKCLDGNAIYSSEIFERKSKNLDFRMIFYPFNLK